MAYTDLLKGRRSEAFHAYFVTMVTQQRNPVFTDLYCAREFIAVLRNLHTHKYIYSLAWVLMPDHFHGLFQLGQEAELAKVMRLLKGKSARIINKRLRQEKALWQKEYYDRAIRKDDDIKQVARYIVANPLRSGLVNHIGDYSHWDAIWL